MLNEKKIREEMVRYDSYVDNPKYCVESEDNPMYKGIVKALRWVLQE